MSGYEDEVPAYLTIRVTEQDSPVAAFADLEAWHARDRYPRLMGVGLGEFFFAREREDGGWELCGEGNGMPQRARDALGSFFRHAAHDAGQEGDLEARRRWTAAASRMDREAVDELRVKGRRFRIVRASQFVRTGAGGPEPPRPTDPDPGEPGDAHLLPSRTKGFVVDPFTGTGLSEGFLKLDLIRFVGVSPDAPREVGEDARRAVHEYPGGVLLPAAFLISTRVEGRWRLHQPGRTYATPQAARDGLAGWLRVTAPFSLELSDAGQADYAQAADRLDERRANGLSVDGRRFRITRVERLVRIGPDGPEGPRPSDFDCEVPAEVRVRRLKERGLWREEPEDGDAGQEQAPPELDAEDDRFGRLVRAEQRRLAEVRQRRKRRKES